MEKLVLNNSRVNIESGELVSYVVNGHEFIHQKGSPGWRNSDTEMFPIIGPTSEADFQVKTERGYAVQDQHGLLRELEYELKSLSETSANYVKTYIANTAVQNSKFPEKSAVKDLSWPYNFTFQKQFTLSENGLEISFTIDGEKGMPFMLGYHPAFKLHSESPTVENENKSISLEDVLAVGNRAYQVSDCEKVVLKDKKNLVIKTEGFGNFMLWTEVSNMICIEPISFYPYAVNADKLHKGFQILNDSPKVFKVYLLPEN
ncbi:aldose 1-epimerase [Aurantibacter crassamenti]|uniref:aldose epimerase family protein n=1 Tax=Aurantibacter crassamenti TaxID=1837375 RepID=UPI00193A3FFF|nr:aldose 1-epimerase [Aurantibacter crassamenti]MBM1106179.1 aldose 1-epimerase [Aurantibacter crassamenti]